MTHNELKYYSSLLRKKYRNSEKKFLVEGKKSVEEGLESNFHCEKIFVSHKFFENTRSRKLFKKADVEVLKRSELVRLTDTMTPQGIMAAFKIPEDKKLEELESETIVYAENIADPGNLGTIIRICDWFGIDTLLVSDNTVDVYNPKVIRSTMGSIFHINIIEEIENESLDILKKKGYKLICADLQGENLYEFNTPSKKIIAFGNEAAGPSKELLEKSDYKITIPKFGKAESLNVAVASAIILSEMVKKSYPPNLQV
jgi:TrmH family RNA methyltransferase